MKSKTFLIIFLTFFGELLIVLGILHFSHLVPHNITYMNIGVSSFMFLVVMTRMISPINYLSHRSQKLFAGTGILSVSLLLYSGAAIWLMFGMNRLLSLSFTTQLLVHAGLLFLLGLSVFFSMTATDQAGTVQMMITSQRARLDKLRRIAASTGEKASRADIAQAERDRIQSVIASLRYISPAGSAEAENLEDTLLEELQRLDSVLSVEAPDPERLQTSVFNFESLCSQRKQIYSQ
jgi:hypothetical protein